MTRLENMDTKEKLIREFYTWLFDDERITVNSLVLEKELDISLAPFYADPNIYYPKEISDFFKTEAMKRLGRISQLGLSIDIYPNLYHNRLEHSKGVYNRKLEEFLYNYQDLEWRRKIEKQNQKIYLLADLIKMAGHDIGHFPLSHLMEIEILSVRGAHEILGKRIMLENSEIHEVLTTISPELPNILKELYEQQIMNFNQHDESSYDVDRFDYISRDFLYFGTPTYFPYETYETVAVELDDNGSPKTLSDFSIVESTNSNSYIDVYDFNSLPNIERFLKSRLSGYKEIYSSPLVHIHEKTVSPFFKAFNTTFSNCGSDLHTFIKTFKNQDINTIDLTEFLKWDEIKLYSQILDIAENHPDCNIRSLAIMTIPTIEAFLNMIYSHLQVKGSINKDYSRDDKEFLKRIKYLIKSNSQLSIALRNPHYKTENTLFFPIDSIISLPKTNLLDFIFMHKKDKFAYNSDEPIYIRDISGKIYELSHHPNRSLDWNKLSIRLESCYTYVPYLKFNGVSKSDIDILRTLSCGIDNYLNDKNTSYLTKINMQPLQVGHNIENPFLELEI